MSDVRSLTFKPDKLEAVLASLERIVAEHRKQTLVSVGILSFMLVPLVFAAVFIGVDVWFVLFIAAIYGMVLPIVLLVMTRNRKRRTAKVRFICSLLRGLADDLMPGERARLEVDLRSYKEQDKPWWTGRSMFGNPKAKYTDKWMTLSAALADGSRLVLRRQAGVKTKSGGITKEKRRMFVRVKPNPALYDVPKMSARMGGLKKLLKTSAQSVFENTPEQFHVHTMVEDGVVKVRVTQEDTDFTTEEVLDLLRVVLGFFGAHDRRPRGDGQVEGVYR